LLHGTGTLMVFCMVCWMCCMTRDRGAVCDGACVGAPTWRCAGELIAVINGVGLSETNLGGRMLASYENKQKGARNTGSLRSTSTKCPSDRCSTRSWR
jgi:hypothetical protein